MRLALFVLGALLLGSASARAFEWLPGVPLTRQGALLIYDDEPFAAVGVNKHELLDQYMADLLGSTAERADEARAAAEQSLKGLADLGVSVIRVRASGFWPAQIERTYLHEDPQVRQAFWQAFDAMLDDCDRYGIRVVLTIAWHLGGWADLAHESLTDLFTDSRSQSRQMLDKWVEDLVSRYRQRDTVLLWELTNESNLSADLRPMFADKGCLSPHLDKPAPHIVKGPIIRDGRNNYSSDELAALTRDLARFIKSIDPDRLVGTGFSAPRPAAWHLWLGSIRKTDKMDWTQDTPEQAADYLRLVSPDPVDVISLHTYGSEFERMLNFKLAADSIGKPVYVGEIGASGGVFGEPVYDSPAAVKAFGILLAAMREMGIPISLAWTWDEWGKPVHEPVLRPEAQPDVVQTLRQANEAAAGQAGQPALDEDGLHLRMQELTAQFQALQPPKEDK